MCAIIVLGLNSAIDVLADVETLAVGAVNRLRAARHHVGGKGVHVAQACAALGEPVRLIGGVDRAHASDFAEWSRARGVTFDGVELPTRLRTCYAIRDARGAITELLEPGSPMSAPVQQAMHDRLWHAARAARVIVLTGSLPAGCADDTYARIIADVALRAPGAAIVLDASGAALRAALPAGPTFVKPNQDEASALIGRPIADADAAKAAAREIHARGAAVALVSLGAAGVTAVWKDGLAAVRPPRVSARNAVGSGDCFVAGLAVGVARGEATIDVLRLATACGAANALTDEPGWFAAADVEALRPRVDVRWIDPPA